MLLVAFIFKTIGVALKNLGLFVLSVYDLIIFAPLWIERRVKGTAKNRSAGSGGRNSDDDDDDLFVLDKKSTQKPEQPPKRERDKNKERELQQA
jgi:hypothetical protein